MLPRCDEGAVLIEHLNAIVFAVGDIHPTPGTTDEDVVGLVEVAGRGSLAPPVLDKMAVLRKLHHAACAVLIRVMAVGNKDVAIGRHGNAGRPVEPIRAGSGHTLLAEHHQYLALRAQLEHFLAHDHAVRVPGRHAEDRLRVVDVGSP